ncbi:DMT family transporter [bacterium]|nr:DMT family transporter [bacterium]MBU1063297.1 DMT family transporter [bacterium]MBU1634798.1 DMT family transporter [bacterium]MBU1874033.1 DMT family transporter [bacterium]
MWYIIAILSGFFFASADALSKRESQRTPAIVLAWVREFYALPFLLLLLFFIDIPDLKPGFWSAILICVAIDLLTTFLYMRAIQIAPLSLTVPYLGLTPIFLLLIPTIVLGERLTGIGIIGVILVSAGTYTLQIDRVKYGIFEPWLAIFKNRGSLYMFCVAILYSVTATYGKVAIIKSSPLFMTILYFSLLAAGFTLIVLFTERNNYKTLFEHPVQKLSIGLAMALMAITHFTAIGMIQVAYMISIKRLSLLFAIIYGALLFKETNLKERLLGGLFIIAGAAFIAFA